jgi:predicted kinase
MKKIIITIGISGSGKSTWAKAFCRDNQNWLRINRDDIRKSILSVSLNEYHQWVNDDKYRIEKLVSFQQNHLLVKALENGLNVIVDNMHLKQSYLKEYRKLLTEHFEELSIEYKLFDVNVESCIEQDKNRIDVVGETVILEQAEKLKILKKNFKFQPEVIVRESFKVVQDETLPHAILVDIDGTVAQMQSRHPFDWDRVGEDLPKQPIINTVKALKVAGNEVIFFSGRDEVCRNISREWICEYFDWKPSDFQLFMRKTNDYRKDSDIKFELFNAHIKNKYFVELVVDDRQQVVDMWRRKLGLTCLQVNYGDF